MNLPIPDEKEMMMRIRQDLLDSYDEELELEAEDAVYDYGRDPLSDDEARNIALERQQYFRELFRLQGELVKLQAVSYTHLTLPTKA